jgi:hypothetical protein
VDLILSAAICLVWYDVTTFGSSDLTVSVEKPSLTNFIEDIATNILMSLSFSFSGCIMVIGFALLLKFFIFPNRVAISCLPWLRHIYYTCLAYLFTLCIFYFPDL